MKPAATDTCNRAASSFSLRRVFRVVYLLLIILPLVLLQTGETINACIEPTQTRAFLKLEGVPGESSDDKHKIEVISPYLTVAVNEPSNCALAIAHSGQVIESIDEVTLVFAQSGITLLTFRRDTTGNVCAGFFGNTEFKPCQGFLASVNTPFPVNQEVSIRVRLSLRVEATPQQLQADLLSEQIGTDEANANGTLKGTHKRILTVGEVVVVPPMIMTVPTLSEYGAVILTALLLALGLIYLAKRPLSKSV